METNRDRKTERPRNGTEKDRARETIGLLRLRLLVHPSKEKGERVGSLVSATVSLQLLPALLENFSLVSAVEQCCAGKSYI